MKVPFLDPSINKSTHVTLSTLLRSVHSPRVTPKSPLSPPGGATMTTVIKKLWETISLNPSSSTTSNNDDKIIFTMTSASSSSSTGEFDKLPYDIFMQILKMIGPRESGRLCGVCKTWRFMIGGDNKLWIYFFQNHQLDPPDSVFFAELHLRSGPPLRAMGNMMPDFSFMQIYGQRAQVPGAVIIDGGSGYCKFGGSKHLSPSGQSATFLEFGNIESPLYSRHRHFFTTIYSRMQVRTFSQPIVLSIPICHHDDTESDRAARRQLKDAIYSALFDLNVPAVCAINQATLALFAARRTSGIVVNIGFHHTSIVPILHGKVMHMVGVEVVGIGALKVTGFLKDQMAKNNIPFQSLYTVRTLKENLCYVALDYEAELSKNTEASFEVASEGWFTLSKERFQTGEILFQPSLAGLRAMGLHQAVALCIDHCRDAELTEEDSWYKTVVLAGGTACLPGLSERLEKELHGCFPPHLSSGVRVHPPPYGAHSAWFGAKLVSNLSTFPSSWCVTKKQVRPKSRRKLLW